MGQVSERRNKPRRRTVREAGVVWVTLEGVPGAANGIRGKVVDVSETGLGVEIPSAIALNTLLWVRPEGSETAKERSQARVVRCIALPHRSYQAGLTYEQASKTAQKPEPVKPIPDYYEILQLNPKADPEMIHRVYRLLAQRFHPDNGETGDAETFRGILEAYKVLSDPEKRAAYDVHLEAYKRFRWRIFDPGQTAVGKQAERTKRRGLLELLYTARMNQPNQPTLSIHEFEDLLGCPKEHLEFTLWYLKENGLLTRTDSGRYSITVKGVDQVENEEPVRPSNVRMLAAST